MRKLRLAGVLTAIALVVGLLVAPATVAAQGVTVISGNVTFNGVNADAGTSVRAVDADGAVVAETTTGLAGFNPQQYRMDVTFGAGSALIGATLDLQVKSGDTWVPAAGAVTVTFGSNVVITQDIETDSAAPVEGGVAGPAGPAGADGADGAAGAVGPGGPPGPRGPAGADGAAGATGAAGAKGSTGAAGAPGAPGATGATGPAGANGANGADGANGSNGDDASSTLALIALIIAIVAAVAAGANVLMGQKK